MPDDVSSGLRTPRQPFAVANLSREIKRQKSFVSTVDIGGDSNILWSIRR
jgi:hypothetical protein